MTTPRPHAELAARYMADSTLKCWMLHRDGKTWVTNTWLAWSPEVIYHVGHEPPPIKRTITLTTNGREWVLPEPLSDSESCDYWYIAEDGGVQSGRKGNDYYDQLRLRIRLGGGHVYAIQADAQAWAEYDKWCRGGGV